MREPEIHQPQTIIGMNHHLVFQITLPGGISYVNDDIQNWDTMPYLLFTRGWEALEVLTWSCTPDSAGGSEPYVFWGAQTSSSWKQNHLHLNIIIDSQVQLMYIPCCLQVQFGWCDFDWILSPVVLPSASTQIWSRQDQKKNIHNSFLSPILTLYITSWQNTETQKETRLRIH
jgi:hypothetical protein